MPAGAVIVLAAAAIFTVSLLFAPPRGVVAWSLRRIRLRLKAAETRALLAMADGYLPPDRLAAEVARRRGFLDRNGRMTPAGEHAARETRRQQDLWRAYRQRHPDASLSFNPLAGGRIEDSLPADIVAALESDIA